MGLYKDFDEILLYCPDSIYDAVRYMKEEYDAMDPEDDYDERLALNMYSSTVAYMEFGNLYDKGMLLELQRSDYFESISDGFLIQDLPREYDRQTEALCLSSALHILHQQYPDIHNNAINNVVEIKEYLAREKGIDIEKTEKEITLPCPEHLTGKSDFPEYLSRLVDEKLDGIKEDIYVEPHITWFYSHLNCGLDYNYENSEYPYVTIRSLNPQSLQMAQDRLEKITDKEVIDRKELYEKEIAIERKREQEQRIEKYSKDKPEPYFENKYCSCYKVSELPKDLSPYTINPDKDNFTPMFTISTPETNRIYMNNREVDYEMREELLPGNQFNQIIGDGTRSNNYLHDKGYLYSYEEIKDNNEFKERVDKCMDKLIERAYDKEHDEKDRDIERDINR